MRPTRQLLAALALAALLALVSASHLWVAGPAWAMLCILVALALVDVRATRSQPALEVLVDWPGTLRVCDPFTVTYHLRNRAARALEVTLLDARAPGLGGDLLLGPLRVPGKSVLTHAATWVPLQRGRLQIGALLARTRSVLGFFERRLTLRTEGPTLRVVPNPGSVSDAVVGPFRESGVRVRRAPGESLELDSLRPFSEGDDRRHVDWQATARAQQLIVRTFREERNQSLVVAVDVGRMMATQIGELSKLDHALNATAALAQAALVHGDRVGFAAFDAEIRTFVPARHARSGMAQLLEATLGLQPRPLESSYRVLTELLERSHRKRSLIIVLTDFVESADALELEGYLARLARRHVVLLVALRDPALSELDSPRPDIDEPSIYRRLVLQDLAIERDLVLRRLTRLGVHTLDVRPERARAPVLSRYLALRRAL